MNICCFPVEVENSYTKSIAMKQKGYILHTSVGPLKRPYFY